MKKHFARLLAVTVPLCVMALAGCGPKASGTMAEKTAALEGGVYSLELHSPGVTTFKKLEASVICGGDNTCRLTADDNVMDDLSLDIDEASKKITLTGNTSAFDVSVSLLVSADVGEISASGAYNVFYNAGSGLSDIRAGLSGASDIDITGECQNADLRASGGSDIHAFGLKAKNVTVNVSGGSDAEVCATEKLDVSASGGSDVIYDGSPAEITQNTSGGSELKAR